MSFFARLPVEPLQHPNPDNYSVCVTSFAYGHYVQYIPTYIYSILKSYPNYYCKIFVDEHLPRKSKQSLGLIRKHLSNNFEVKAIDHASLGGHRRLFDRYRCKPALRWFIPHTEFTPFDYVYYGDVDFFIVPEMPSLADQHVAHMSHTGLSYSNAVRKTPRLTGLHFVNREHFFARLATDGWPSLPAIENWLHYAPKSGRDEQILYKLTNYLESNKSSITSERFRPYHGFHLAASRSSFYRLFFKDIRHQSSEANQIFHGWNCYPRESLFRCIKSLFLNDPLFLELYSLHATPCMRRTLITVEGMTKLGFGELTKHSLSSPYDLSVKVVRRLSG